MTPVPDEALRSLIAGLLDEAAHEHSPLRDFQRDCDLDITDIPGADIAAVANLDARVKASGKLEQVTLDPAGMVKSLPH